MSIFKLFLLSYIIAVGMIYAIRLKGKTEIILPGDIYIEKQGMHIYFPISSSLLLAIVLFIIFRTLL